MQHSLRLAGALVLSGTLALSACGSDDGGSTGSGGSGGSGGGDKVAAVIKGLDNPFFQAMEDGIKAQAKDDSVSVTVQAAQSITDTTGQSDKLTALAQQDFGCFVVNPISGTNLVNGLARIGAQDIPIVNIDSPVDAKAAEEAGVDLTTYIGTDNTEAGGKAGDAMVEAVGSGKVALIGGISGDVTSGARLDGFKQAVDGKLDIVQTTAADWERQKALTAATTIMDKNPDLKGFFAANDDMGLGIVQAVKNAGKTGKVQVISVDGNKDALEAVEAGDLYATVAQYPYAVGQLGVQACEKAMAGDDVPSNIVSPTALVTKDKAADAISKLPAPFEDFDNPLD